MPDYDFRALSPIDFEILTRDLLQKELGLTLESFRSGPDSGIDFRYISLSGNQLVIQCKHHVDSTFAGLLRKLKISELPKVQKLTPQRYLLAISRGLTPKNKDAIQKAFRPFIKSPSDIFGRDDLNNLLGKFPEVEKNTFKLWFSSTSVFENLLRTRGRNLSRETLSRIQRNARLYVQNDSFAEALSILQRLNFCVIVGVPGIGKTMLAEMLLLRYYSRKFDIVKIEGDISEASDVDYTNRRRIFYYDDFRGQASIAEKLNKNEDQKLIDFILAIKHSKVSKLILTTREYILNQAKLVYEKIDRTRFDLETCIVDLSKYTRLNRAKILFNHIYFSDLPTQHKGALLQDRAYLRIIDHGNYSPRIIEYMTDTSRLTDIGEEDYVNRFISSLDNPEDLWRHAFLSQIFQESRDLLIVLVTLPTEVFLDDLEVAFRSYREKTIKTTNREQLAVSFKRALKELDGNFVAIAKSGENLIVQFQNPSVRDFLQNYLASSVDELRSILSSVACFDQLYWLWEHQDSRRAEPRFRELLTKKLSSEFMKALRLVFVLPPFRLVLYGTRNGPSRKGRTTISAERRSSLIASVAAEIKSNASQELLSQTLDYLDQRLASGNIDREDLVSLIQQLKEFALLRRKELDHVLLKAKTSLANNIDWLHDYWPLLRFMKSFPKTVSATERAALAKAFPSFARTHVLSELVIDDPDEYRTYAEEVKSIGKDFGLDVSALVEEIESKASDEEGEVEKEDDQSIEIEDPNKLNAPLEEICSDSDIDSIFSSLRYEEK